MTEQGKETLTPIELLADPEFKSFIDKFSEHYNSISHLSLEEQRKHDAEFV